MNVECPHCKQHYVIDEQYAGQTVECSACKKEFCIEPFYDKPQEAVSQGQGSISNVQVKVRGRIVQLTGGILFVLSLLVILFMFIKNTSLTKEITALNEQINILKNEVKSCQQTIEDLKFGPERLKAEAEAAVKDGNLEKAKQIFDNLFERHPHKKIDPKYKHSFDNIVRQIKDKEKCIAQQKAQQEAALLANISKKYDQMQSITWYSTKRDSKYVTQEGSGRFPDEYYSIELYTGHRDNGSKLLRLRTRYYVYGSSRTWIFYKRVQIKGSNGVSVYIATEYPEKQSESSHGSIEEWADNNVNDIADKLTEIAKSKEIFVKFYGKYPFEFKMNAEQTAAFKEIIARYNSL